MFFQTRQKQRKDNKSKAFERAFFFLTLFEFFEKTSFFKKQRIKRPTKSKRFKGSKRKKHGITINRNPKKIETKKAHFPSTRPNIAPLLHFFFNNNF